MAENKNKSPLDGSSEASWIHQMDHDLARQRARAYADDDQRQLDETITKDELAHIKDLIKSLDDDLNDSDDDTTNATHESIESKTDSASAQNKPTAKNVSETRSQNGKL